MNNKMVNKIPKTLTIHLTYASIVLAIIALLIGYSLGNLLPINFTGRMVGTNTQEQQPESAGIIQISDPFGNDPIIGNKNSPVVMIEFSDFQCPFCRRFYTQTLSQIESDYINTGKVVLVYKDFPLESIHPGAVPAALAAECAKDQNKWREFHNKIFDEQEKQGTGTVQFSNDDLKKWASEIQGLDVTSFNQCFDSQKHLDEVQADFQEGINLGVTGTPTFYIGNAQKGFTQVVGAQPYSVLKSVIDQYLS